MIRQLSNQFCLINISCTEFKIIPNQIDIYLSISSIETLNENLEMDKKLPSKL